MLRTLLFAVLLAPLQAHQIDEQWLSFERTADGFVATLRVDAAYMLPEYRGDADIAPFDLAWLRTREPGEWARIREATRGFLRDSLEFRLGGEPLDYPIRFPDFDHSPPPFMSEGIAEAPPMLEVRIEQTLPQPLAEPLDLAWDESFGVVLLVFRDGVTEPIVSGESITLLDAGGASTKPAGLGRWVELGMRHIVPDGLDHVLFILGIFLLQPKPRPLLLQSLLFTLAHSVTLSLAALGWLPAPERLVEALIAASILWIGVENLWLKEPGRGRYALIATFGLIHGLGFARMLAPLLPDDDPGALVGALAGFHLGVELGQLLVLAIAFALAAWWSAAAFRWLRLEGSTFIAIAGALMLVDRLA